MNALVASVAGRPPWSSGLGRGERSVGSSGGAVEPREGSAGAPLDRVGERGTLAGAVECFVEGWVDRVDLAPVEAPDLVVRREELESVLEDMRAGKGARSGNNG